MSQPSRRALLRSFGALSLTGGLGAGLLTASGPMAFADEKDDKIREKKNVDQQLDDVRASLEGVEEDLATTYMELAETELKIPDAQARLDDARSALAEAKKEDKRIADRLTAAQEEEKDLSAQVEKGEKEITQSSEKLSQASLDAYKGSGMPSVTSVFIGSENPQETVDRSVNYRLTLEAQGTQLSGQRTEHSQNVNAADRLQAVREEITDLKKQSEEAVRVRENAEQEAEQAKASLDELYRQQQKQQGALESKKKQYQGDQSRLQSTSDQLDGEIKRLIEEERKREVEAQRRREEEARRRRKPAPKPKRNTVTSSYSSRSTGQGQFLSPVNGRMSSPFGWRIHPIFGYRKLHAGQDWAVPEGTPIMAMTDGKVLSVGPQGGGGKVVEISHGLYNGQLLVTRHLHLSGYACSRGQVVTKGQVIGYVGSTGNSTGPHLHFETLLNGTPVDPRGFIG